MSPIGLRATMAGPAIQVAVSALDRLERQFAPQRPEFLAILARRKPGENPECPDEGAVVAVTDLFGHAVDGHVLFLKQPLGGFDADPAKILPRRHAGGGKKAAVQIAHAHACGAHHIVNADRVPMMDFDPCLKSQHLVVAVILGSDEQEIGTLRSGLRSIDSAFAVDTARSWPASRSMAWITTLRYAVVAPAQMTMLSSMIRSSNARRTPG
jgi:hypothetical protein